MIWLILIVAFLLRLINLDQSLWWDEAINIVYAKENDFLYFVSKYPLGDFHPSGYFAVIWLWGHLFDFSEGSMRLPSVIFGILTVFMTYLIGKKLFSKKVGLWAALFLTAAPLHIYYSQEARMYSFAAFAASLATYFLIRFVQGEKLGKVGYALSVGLLLYSDYLSYLILPAHFIWVILFHRKNIKPYFLSLISGIIFILPWLLIFPEQFKSGQLTANSLGGWKEVVGRANLKEFLLLTVKTITGRVNFNNNVVYLVFFSILALPFVVIFYRLLKFKFERGIFLLRSNKLALLWFWVILPPVAALFISFFIPVFSYFRFIFILPAFYLLVAVGVEKYKPKLSKVLAILIIFSGLAASSVYLFNSSFHREDWRGAISFVSKQLNNQSIALFEYNEIPAPVRYYQSDLSNFRSVPEGLETDLQNKNRVFLFEYLADVYDPDRLLEAKLKNYNFVNTKTYDFRGVGFIKAYEK